MSSEAIPTPLHSQKGPGKKKNGECCVIYFVCDSSREAGGAHSRAPPTVCRVPARASVIICVTSSAVSNTAPFTVAWRPLCSCKSIPPPSATMDGLPWLKPADAGQINYYKRMETCGCVLHALTSQHGKSRSKTRPWAWA